MAVEGTAAAASIEAQVAEARNLLKQQRFGEALALATRLSARVPDNRDALYIEAVSLRYVGRVPEALGVLTRFEALHPGYGRLFQERGHCLRAVGQPDAAIHAYSQAVERNGTLIASWRGLVELYTAAGRTQAADHAKLQAVQVSKLPRAVLDATHLMSEGNLPGAEQILRAFLQEHSDHIEAMRLLAQIGMQLDVLDDAEFLLESVLVFAPDYQAARYDYALVLSRRHKFAQAEREASTLLQSDPSNRAFRTLMANTAVGLGRHEHAAELFAQLAHETPDNPEIHLSVGHALKTLGRQQAAIEAYRAAADARPSFGDAYWSLANLKTYLFTSQEIDGMRRHVDASDTTLVDRYHLNFALAKSREDAADYAEAFFFYARGNALKHSEHPYDVRALEKSLRRQRELCDTGFFAERKGWGSSHADSIFIVGLPRAGSTLLEQILASHSRVEGTMELADIPRLVQLLNGRESSDSPSRYPDVLADLTAAQALQYGERYISDTRIYRGHGSRQKPFFIDKMPNNFRHIALLQLILPNAKIIDARREPMACCFSNFKQLFASGQEFTYDLGDIARYYLAYVEIMDHWDRTLPGKILRVQHEAVVDDLQGSVRRILDFCGLEFEAQCVEFHKTERSVRTASSEQVRRPINRDGLDQWRHFEPWLESLKDALRPVLG